MILTTIQKKLLLFLRIYRFLVWGMFPYFKAIPHHIPSVLKEKSPGDICSQSSVLGSSLQNQSESLGVISYEPGSMPLLTVERNLVSRTKHRSPNPLKKKDWISD